MGVNRLNSGVPPEQAQPERPWLELLHLEQDGDLTPQQQKALLAVPDQAEVRHARLALAQVNAHLYALKPCPMPYSLAPSVAQEVAWSARLGSVGLGPDGLRPTLPRSVASAVVAEVALSAQLGQAAVPRLPHSVAANVAAEIRIAHTLNGPGSAFAAPALASSLGALVAAEVSLSAQVTPPALPRSVAASVVARVRQEHTHHNHIQQDGTSQDNTRQESLSPDSALTAPATAAPSQAAVSAFVALALPKRNPAPLLLVVSLMVGLLLLAITTTWPNLAAGALVMRTLLAQVSPLAGVGLLVLLLTSALVTWRPVPAMRQVGAGAFALSAFLTLPTLYNVAVSGDIRFGQDITVNAPVGGNVIAVGGNIHLHSQARVRGEVITLLGDVYREPGAQVSGRVNALLGHAPGDREALQTDPPTGLRIATAAAFRPVLGWLGSAAWPQIFVTLTATALLLLFVAGLAPLLARRQRHAPMRTLALGVLAVSALVGPAFGLALAGLLGPSLVAAALAVLLIAVGLSVSAYDVGRAVAYRARLPVPDAVGAMLGLTAVAASLGVPPLAFALGVVGGTWGAGTLLLSRQPQLSR